MTPGTYKVYLGVYRRSTGSGSRCSAGRSDGENRILLGTFEVKTL